MSRKIIWILSLVMVIPVLAVMAFAEGNFLHPGEGSVTAGDSASFKIVLDELTEEEYGPYKITIEVSPTEPVAVLDVKENVDITMNKVNGKYSLTSADIANVKTLNFTLKTDSDIDEETEYTVNVSIAGEKKSDEDSFTFTVKPKKQKHRGGGSSGGGFSDAAEDVDDVNIYKGSSDNYLQQLAVSGYAFTQKFHKTKSVYFVNAKDDTTSLQVTAVPCDKAAKVQIAGNSDVSADYSKIVISVTASNGDIRYYTIYVRHNWEDQQ